MTENLGEDALRVKGNFSWGFEEKKDEKDKEKEKKKEKDKKKKKSTAPNDADDKEKPLGDFITLKNIDISVKKGEFICVIGDVGCGKTSLFTSVIGDMIYLPEEVISEFGGPEKMGKKADYKALKDKVLSKEFRPKEAPVKVDGSLSYVE